MVLKHVSVTNVKILKKFKTPPLFQSLNTYMLIFHFCLLFSLRNERDNLLELFYKYAHFKEYVHASLNTVPTKPHYALVQHTKRLKHHQFTILGTKTNLNIEKGRSYPV